MVRDFVSVVGRNGGVGGQWEWEQSLVAAQVGPLTLAAIMHWGVSESPPYHLNMHQKYPNVTSFDRIVQGLGQLYGKPTAAQPGAVVEDGVPLPGGAFGLPQDRLALPAPTAVIVSSGMWDLARLLLLRRDVDHCLPLEQAFLHTWARDVGILLARVRTLFPTARLAWRLQTPTFHANSWIACSQYAVTLNAMMRYTLQRAGIPHVDLHTPTAQLALETVYRDSLHPNVTLSSRLLSLTLNALLSSPPNSFT